MKKQFVTFQIAAHLKRLGLDEPCLAYFRSEHLRVDEAPYEYITHFEYDEIKESSIMTDCVFAPLWQQAIDWLRDNPLYQWEIIVQRDSLISFEYIIRQLGNHSHSIKSDKSFYSHEEGREKAILKVIELIDLKNQEYEKLKKLTHGK